MPELPEVETVKRVIEPQIVNRKIVAITINCPTVIAYPDYKSFCNCLKGQVIKGMTRRGKFLQILLQNEGKIIIHLRMTGCILVESQENEIEKHAHVILHLDNGKDLRFIDTRRFGRWWYIPTDTQDIFSGINKLGLEPFDENLTPDYLKAKIGKRKKTIKECLLDQSVVSGIGNIYSDEILFTAKIRPERLARELTDEEFNRLVSCVSERLIFFVNMNAISPEDYLISKGQDYRNTPYLKVYGHANKPCSACGEILQRTIIGGRSSVFCPNCQK